MSNYEADLFRRRLNVMTQERDTYRQLCEELLIALKDCKTDLFFKHENQHGAEKAYKHPSVEKARNAIRKAEQQLNGEKKLDLVHRNYTWVKSDKHFYD